jgi:hypothetical protein
MVRRFEVEQETLLALQEAVHRLHTMHLILRMGVVLDDDPVTRADLHEKCDEIMKLGRLPPQPPTNRTRFGAIPEPEAPAGGTHPLGATGQRHCEHHPSANRLTSQRPEGFRVIRACPTGCLPARSGERQRERRVGAELAARAARLRAALKTYRKSAQSGMGDACPSSVDT